MVERASLVRLVEPLADRAAQAPPALGCVLVVEHPASRHGKLPV